MPPAPIGGRKRRKAFRYGEVVSSMNPVTARSGRVVRERPTEVDEPRDRHRSDDEDDEDEEERVDVVGHVVAVDRGCDEAHRLPRHPLQRRLDGGLEGGVDRRARRARRGRPRCCRRARRSPSASAPARGVSKCWPTPAVASLTSLALSSASSPASTPASISASHGQCDVGGCAAHHRRGGSSSSSSTSKTLPSEPSSASASPSTPATVLGAERRVADHAASHLDGEVRHRPQDRRRCERRLEPRERRRARARRRRRRCARRSSAPPRLSGGGLDRQHDQIRAVGHVLDRAEARAADLVGEPLGPAGARVREQHRRPGASDARAHPRATAVAMLPDPAKPTFHRPQDVDQDWLKKPFSTRRAFSSADTSTLAGREHEGLVGDLLHSAVERVGEAGAEVDQPLREVGARRLQVEDHRDVALEAVGHLLRVVEIARGDEVDLDVGGGCRRPDAGCDGVAGPGVVGEDVVDVVSGRLVAAQTADVRRSRTPRARRTAAARTRPRR